MLEQPALLIRAPSQSAGPTRQDIVHAESGTRVGFVRWQPTGWSWLRWLVPPLALVHEVEDEPLLFTLQRVWSLEPRWEVRDADGHLVGSIAREFLLDRYGRCLALVERTGDPARIRFRSPEGQELGQLARQGSEARLEFALPPEGDPFAKMVMLATALAWS
jgi:hypothetical protein